MKNIDLNSKFGTIKQPLESDCKPGLSVIIIVRNEEKNISDCIKSLYPVADEIIINDTGSNDNTINIVRKQYEYAETPHITLIQRKWEDDFALARNQAIEKATHKWILWVDADDRIPEESIEGINLLKTASLDRFFGFQIINTNDGQPIGSRFVQVRMFPNYPSIRFERRIHEHVMNTCADVGLHCIYIPAEIHHTGYENKEAKERKAIRNLRISNLTPELIGVDPSFTMAMGDSHFILEEWKKGIDIYRQCLLIRDIGKVQSDICTMVSYYIAVGYEKLKQPDRAIKWAKEAYRASNHNLNAIYLLGTLHESINKKPMAQFWYKKGIETEYQPSSVCIDLDSVRIWSYTRYTAICVEDGLYDEAIRYLLKAKEHYPEFINLYESLSYCYRCIGKFAKSDEILLELAALKKS